MLERARQGKSFWMQPHCNASNAITWFFTMTMIEKLLHPFKGLDIMFSQQQSRLDIEASKSLANSHISSYCTLKMVEQKKKNQLIESVQSTAKSLDMFLWKISVLFYLWALIFYLSSMIDAYKSEHQMQYLTVQQSVCFCLIVKVDPTTTLLKIKVPKSCHRRTNWVPQREFQYIFPFFLSVRIILLI